VKIGVLTGGGDCPGLNAVIRAVVRKSEKGGDFVLGIRDGWKGLVEGMIEPLTPGAVSGVLPRGGTILGTSRTDPFEDMRDVVKCENNFRHYGLDGLIAVGGEDTLGTARLFHRRGLPVVGVPWTIENELPGTDRTFGSDTALNVAVEAIDRLHSTAESHGRSIVVEVTGRNAGWVAAASAIAGGADCCLMPEEPFDIEAVCAIVRGRRERGKPFSVIVAAEGARPREGSPEGAGSIGAWVAEEVGKRTGVETRAVVLGPIPQGGVPSASDRLIATRAGLRAVDLVRQKKFGRMVALSGSRWTDAPLPAMDRGDRRVDKELFRDAEVFFG
jgi:6-phosphofructokinase 1